MTLGQYITVLEILDPNTRVSNGLLKPHSYRGYYDQLAFEPNRPTSVRQMLADATGCIGREFRGYKGGIYRMGLDTPCWVANYGQCSFDGANQLDMAYLSKMLGIEPGCETAEHIHEEMRQQANQRRMDKAERDRQIREELDALELELRTEHGLIDHPKAGLAWTKAWEHGHSNGPSEIRFWYSEFAEVAK